MYKNAKHAAATCFFVRTDWVTAVWGSAWSFSSSRFHHFTDEQRKVLLLSCSARVQDEHFVSPLWLICSVVSSFLASVSAQDPPFCAHCLIFALITAKARRSTDDGVSCPVAPSGCGGFSSFSLLFSLLTSCSCLSPLWRSFLPGHLSGFINIRRLSQCASTSIFPPPPTFLLILADCTPLPQCPPLLPRSSLSFFPLPHCVRRWQLCSSGALRGAEKTKIWFSGSDLDFLQIGWQIRRSFYSYSTQSLPLQLQTMTADHRGCSYLHKCAICDKASLCFLPKTMTSGGTQCTEVPEKLMWNAGWERQWVKSTRQCTTPWSAHHTGNWRMHQPQWTITVFAEFKP